MSTKAKVYKDIVCLEVASPDGGKWWFQTQALAYTPYHVDRVTRLVAGTLTGSSRSVLAVQIKQEGHDILVAINIPRTDVVALKRKKLVPSSYPLPDRVDVYTPWPDHAQQRLSTHTKATKKLY
jgi:hypothetical protein